MIESLLDWVLLQQTSNGSFHEASLFPDQLEAPVELQTISVTSEVLVALTTIARQNQVNILSVMAKEYG